MAMNSERFAIFDVKKMTEIKTKRWEKHGNNMRNESYIILHDDLVCGQTGVRKIIRMLTDINHRTDRCDAVSVKRKK